MTQKILFGVLCLASPLALAVSQVPEPSTFSLFAASAIAIALLAKLKK